MLRMIVCLAMMVPDISRILSMKRMMLFIKANFIEANFIETLFSGLWAVNAVNVLVITGRVSSRRAP